MGRASILERAVGKYRRSLADALYRRPQPMRNETPLISFTFDDFPRSALRAGGAILQQAGLAASYYVSLGLLGQASPSGPLCTSDDLDELLAQGHELGCHTFDHLDAWQTNPVQFEQSILRNRDRLVTLLPGTRFSTHAYPIMCPRPRSKRQAAAHFAGCRGGGQTYNAGVADLNNLRAFFLEQCGGDFETITKVIDQNREAKGWLIFATHDIDDVPSPYGCTPALFEDTVAYARASGAVILTLADACRAIEG